MRQTIHLRDYISRKQLRENVELSEMQVMLLLRSLRRAQVAADEIIEGEYVEVSRAKTAFKRSMRQVANLFK